MSPSDSCLTRPPKGRCQLVLAARQVSRVASHRVRTCRAYYPGEQDDAHVSVYPVVLGGFVY